jgi:hypothetical protein
MTWDGYIAGSAVLYVQGNRVDVQGRDTGAVDRPRFNFRSALPAARQRADVQMRRGRGRVSILEQPAPENEYSLIVRVDAPDQQHDYYVLDFYWDAARYPDDRRSNRRDDQWQTRNRTVDSPGPGEMNWTGEVDEEALIEVRARRAFARTIRGRGVYGDQAQFSTPMPRNADVQLVDAQGRGRVELVEPPSNENGNVALVRIRDPQSGAGQYSFRLAWNGGGALSGRDDPYYSGGTGGVLTPGGTVNSPVYGGTGYGGNSIQWSGRVDGRVRVTVRGNRAWTTPVSGAPVTGQRVSIGSPLPNREVSNVEVRKLQGREDVKIVERPSSRNGFTLTFEIDDDDAGADDYVVEVTWS